MWSSSFFSGFPKVRPFPRYSSKWPPSAWNKQGWLSAEKTSLLVHFQQEKNKWLSRDLTKTKSWNIPDSGENLSLIYPWPTKSRIYPDVPDLWSSCYALVASRPKLPWKLLYPASFSMQTGKSLWMSSWALTEADPSL